MKQNALLGLAAAFREPDPSMYYTEETRLPKALAYAVTAVGMWVRKGEIYIPYLDEAVMDTFQHLRTVHQYVGYDEKDAQVVGYQASDITLEEWRQMFLRSPRAAQQIRRRLAENVRLGFPMPPAAGEFAAELADGLQDPKRKSKKKTLTHRDTLLAGIAKKVSAAYNLHLGATKVRLSESPPPVCGAVIAAAAMHGHGVTVNFTRADTISRNKSLPIDLLRENYVFKIYDLLPLPEHRNALAPIEPDEYRADPHKRYGEQYHRAAKHLGIQLPISDIPQ